MGGSLWAQGQLGLQSKDQDSQAYKTVLKTKKENNQLHEIAAIEIEETMCHPNIK